MARLAKAGKLKGLSRAEFDKLPEVAHLSEAERDAAYLRFVLGEELGQAATRLKFSGITPRNADEERFLGTLRVTFGENSVWTEVTRHRGNIIVQRSDIELSIQNLRNMKNGRAPYVKDSDGKWQKVVLHHVGRKDGKLIEVMEDHNDFNHFTGGPLHIPGPGGPIQKDLSRTYWKQRFDELVKSGRVDPEILKKLGVD